MTVLASMTVDGSPASSMRVRSAFESAGPEAGLVFELAGCVAERSGPDGPVAGVVPRSDGGS